ncbi:hypothetical protein HY251_21610 [bacterium]|nr:hypothetical protein [bacterium]
MSPSDDADFFTKLVSVNLEHNDLDAALASLETAAARSTTATQRSRAASAAASLVERLERGKDLARAARARGILASLESGRREDPRPASLTETPPAAAASREVGRA